MTQNKYKQTLITLLKDTGIKINGENPWDIRVTNENFYPRVLAGGSLALGESYTNGWWNCESIDQLIEKILLARLDKKVKSSPQAIWNSLKARLLNQQNKSKAKIVGKIHYDVGNDLYKAMLDERMNYSCGYWKEADNLNNAQEAKLDLICRKLNLKPGITLLDIGCGFGSMAKFAAEKYGIKVLGITISREQAKLARKLCAGLDIEIKMKDYRDLDGKYDRIVSIGMFEHVGYKNYREYMKTAFRCLKNNGLFLLHTIGGNLKATDTDPWFEKYIFPHSMLPSSAQITKAYEGLFILEDWHSFGQYYDKTLMAWHQNFIENWDKIKKAYDSRFFRMWNYYLLSSAGSFRANKNQLWQIVLSKLDSTVTYESIR